MTQNVMGREPDTHRHRAAAALRRYNRIGRTWRTLGLMHQWAAVGMFFGLPYFIYYEPFSMDWPWPGWVRLLYLPGIIGGAVIGHLCIRRGEARQAAYYDGLEAQRPSSR